MKISNIVRASAITLTLAAFVSCATANLPEKLDSFVDKAELKSEKYDQDDWKKSVEEYEKLVDEYTNYNKEYTEAEKQMALRAMGRYHALLVKNGLKESASYLKELGKLLPSYLNGLVEGIGEDGEGFLKELEEAFDSEELEKSFENLGEALENLLGGSCEE